MPLKFSSNLFQNVSEKVQRIVWQSSQKFPAIFLEKVFEKFLDLFQKKSGNFFAFVCRKVWRKSAEKFQHFSSTFPEKPQKELQKGRRKDSRKNPRKSRKKKRAKIKNNSYKSITILSGWRWFCCLRLALWWLVDPLALFLRVSCLVLPCLD